MIFPNFIAHIISGYCGRFSELPTKLRYIFFANGNTGGPPNLWYVARSNQYGTTLPSHNAMAADLNPSAAAV